MLELWGKVVIKAHVCPTLSLCVGIGKHNKSVSGSVRRSFTILAWPIHLDRGNRLQLHKVVTS
jgi:hypothetical protein